MVTKYVKAGAVHVTQNAFAISASVATTIGLFILLPIINAIAEGARADTMLIPVDSTEIPPPPDVMEEEEPEPEEPEPEEEPPELQEDTEPFDLAQLEMMMSSDFGSGGVGAVDFKIDLSNVTGGGGVEGLFDMSELDGKPTAIDRPQPSLNATEKKATPGRVMVIFIVDSRGRVQNPKVQSSSNPALEAAALRAVKKWRFQPGTRKGKAVSTRARQSIDFPKQ